MLNAYQVSAWALCSATVVAFALYSLLMTRTKTARIPASSANLTDVQQYFTAARSCNVWQIAWSFYATAVGAWLIVTPPNYAVLTGVIGLCMYPIAVGLPVMMLAYMGKSVRHQFPGCDSFSEYCKLRFGKLTCGLVVLQSFFSMSIVSTCYCS